MFSHPRVTGGIFALEIKPDAAPVLAFNFQAHISFNWFEFMGEESVTVPAGTIDTLKYRYHLDNYGWPPEDVWVMPGSRQLVKIRWDVLKTTYVLAELNGTPQ